MSIRVVGTEVTEPVSLEEIRTQCRIDDDITEENSLLEIYQTAAREYCESYTGRYFAVNSFRFDGKLKANQDLELAPDLVEVSSIQYINKSGQTLNTPSSDYFVVKGSGVDGISAQESWPDCNSSHPSPVTVFFSAGKEECPSLVKQAILLLVSTWYENRDLKVNASTLEAVKLLLNSHRLVKV